MKTKRYDLTESEVLALKMACVEYWHEMKNIDTKSPVIKKMKSSLYALKIQFSNDYANWKQEVKENEL